MRDAIGDEIGILTGANQALTPRQAIRLARMLEPYDIGWFEEPVPAHDLKGHARVLDAINIPVASGETDFTRFGMKDILDAGAIDTLMPEGPGLGFSVDYDFINQHLSK